METAAQSPADAELQLLTHWGDPAAKARSRKAGVLSVLIHALVIALIVLLPNEMPKAPPKELPHHVTTLIEPLSELTQTAPNHGKVSREFNATSMQPRPRLVAPAGPPAAPRPLIARQSLPAPPPPPPTPRAAPQPPPPPVEAAPKESAKLNLPQTPGPVSAPSAPPAPKAAAPPPAHPQPQIQAQEKNPSPFESINGPAPVVPPSQRRIPIPDIGAAIHGEGVEPAIPVPQPPLMDGSNVELPTLLSNPMGVDFRPYLTRLLATVKRNWLAVWPESAREGRRGKVGVQFAIAKDGTVTKVVWAFQSGTDALDRAAVAAVSMSNPFPPLPLEYPGSRIVLQLNFAYNMARQ